MTRRVELWMVPSTDLEVGGPVPDLVVVVELAAAEQDEDVGQEVVAERAETGERGDGGRAHGGVLQDHAVVDVPEDKRVRDSS